MGIANWVRHNQVSWSCFKWHLTPDWWLVTCDTWWGVNILSKFLLPSSYCLWFMILWRSGGKGWRNHLISDEAVCRTAPATPGLLIIIHGFTISYCFDTREELYHCTLIQQTKKNYILGLPVENFSSFCIIMAQLLRNGFDNAPAVICSTNGLLTVFTVF